MEPNKDTGGPYRVVKSFLSAHFFCFYVEFSDANGTGTGLVDPLFSATKDAATLVAARCLLVPLRDIAKWWKGHGVYLGCLLQPGQKSSNNDNNGIQVFDVCNWFVFTCNVSVFTNRLSKKRVYLVSCWEIGRQNWGTSDCGRHR